MSGTGPAEFARQLEALGKAADVDASVVTWEDTVELGSLRGDTIRLGVEVPTDFPLVAPHGPHVSPAIDHPEGGNHASKLGEDWRHWSRPVKGWAKTRRDVATWLRHVRELFGQL